MSEAGTSMRTMAPLSRRDLLGKAAALGIGVASISGFGRLAVAAPNLTSFTWSGYDAKQFHEAYLAKYKVEPSFSFFSDEEEALQKVRGGFHPDVIHPCVNTVGRFRDAKVIKPIDTSRLTAWDKIFPALKQVRDVEVDGRV